MHRLDFLGERLDGMKVEAHAPVSAQCLARDLEQGPGVGQGHQDSPTTNRANRRTEIASPSLPEASLISCPTVLESSLTYTCSSKVRSATYFLSLPSTILP